MHLGGLEHGDFAADELVRRVDVRAGHQVIKLAELHTLQSMFRQFKYPGLYVARRGPFPPVQLILDVERTSKREICLEQLVRN